MENGTERALASFLVFMLSAAVGSSLIGCRGDAGAGEIVYDTIGGVPAVINPARGLQADSLPWTFTEHLRTGGDQLYERTRAQFALDVGILPDGGFVVLDAGNRRVLQFGRDGGYRRSYGEEGEEPGQFQNPFMLEVADSLVMVLDIALNRVNAFDTAGALVTAFTIDLAGLAGTTPLFEAGASDQIYVAGEPVPFPMSQVRDTGRAVIYRLDSSGAITDTLLSYTRSTWTPIQLPGGRSTFAKPRFAPEPRLDVKASLVVANYVAPYIIDLRRADGTPVRRIARAYENAPVVQQVRDSVLDRLASGRNRLPREVLESIPFEAEIPAIEGLVLDDRGRIWADPYLPEEPTRRDIFETEGRFLGPAYLPEPLQLKDIRGDRVCGVRSDRANRAAEAVCYTLTTGEATAAAGAG